MTLSIGIYAGTFDPVHSGHIAFALAASKACSLDKIVFLPEEQPRAKRRVTALSHRQALLEKAVQAYPNLYVTNVASPQFTVRETLPELRERFGDANLTLLVGSDVARGVSQWPNADKLFGDVRLAVGMRSEDLDTEIQTRLQAIAIPIRATFVKTNFATIASSQIRSGDSAHFNPEVAHYADTHALYTPHDSL